ncbi:hypothetical protein [Caballeronia sp. BCC1704]|uniref:hypothetical protein n=1 Tax=Caballeronia sp. BCC1704 TaxID=2676300 RepID=UPI00158E6D92|nr:hypothetical protein [Caballeronia sp. BCC1704]
MQNNTIEMMARMERISVATDADLLAAIDAHRRRVEQATGIRVTLSQAAAGLLRRGLEAAN